MEKQSFAKQVISFALVSSPSNIDTSYLRVLLSLGVQTALPDCFKNTTAILELDDPEMK